VSLLLRSSRNYAVTIKFSADRARGGLDRTDAARLATMYGMLVRYRCGLESSQMT
jgi:hypothetical protein